MPGEEQALEHQWAQPVFAQQRKAIGEVGIAREDRKGCRAVGLAPFGRDLIGQPLRRAVRRVELRPEPVQPRHRGKRVPVLQG